MRVIVHDRIKIVIHDALGVGNQNSGVYHLGKSGPGSEACCGNQRAYQTFGKTEFNNSPFGARCKRCETYAQRREVERPVSRSAPVAKEQELPPWGSKMAGDMTQAEIRSWLAKNPRKKWREVLEHVLGMKMMRNEK